MKLLIGLVGKKQSGKDTVCKFIQELYPDLLIERIAFADELKEEVSEATQVNLKFIESHKNDFRPILQWWGTDFRRKFYGEDYWIQKFHTHYLNSIADIIVATDVRFQNEADYIKGNNGILIRIVRNDYKKDEHPSEIEQEKINTDYTIINEYSLEILKQTTKQILDIILKNYVYPKQQ